MSKTGVSIPAEQRRALRFDIEEFNINISSSEIRQLFKMRFLEKFQDYINDLKQRIPNLVLCGDYNICHKSIDIHNPIRNKNTSGFLPEEREWMTNFLSTGFIDAFRYFNHDPHSSIFDATQTQVIKDKFSRVLSWYDNEWGFSNRMCDTAIQISKLI